MPQPSSLNNPGLPIIELQSVDSTNNYALTRIHEGLAQHGEAFFAQEQRNGRGQRGREWHAEKGANIILSVTLRPQPLALSQQFLLSMSAALAAHDFFTQYAGEDTSIKWPNDLYWQDRKAGGILIENIIGPPNQTGETGENSVNNRSSWQWAVVGTGININQTSFDPRITNPVSLKQITGKSFDVLEMARELRHFIDKRFSQLISNGENEIIRAYNQLLYKKDQEVRLKKDSRVFNATIRSVGTDGMLQVEHAFTESFAVGEIEWIVKF